MMLFFPYLLSGYHDQSGIWFSQFVSDYFIHYCCCCCCSYYYFFYYCYYIFFYFVVILYFFFCFFCFFLLVILLWVLLLLLLLSDEWCVDYCLYRCIQWCSVSDDVLPLIIVTLSLFILEVMIISHCYYPIDWGMLWVSDLISYYYWLEGCGVKCLALIIIVIILLIVDIIIIILWLLCWLLFWLFSLGDRVIVDVMWWLLLLLSWVGKLLVKCSWNHVMSWWVLLN